MKVFEANDYREFMRAKIAEHGRLRGYQKQLGEAAGCQSSFLSHVLSSHVHMTPDHAAGLANFWGLSENEAEYFVALVNFERATSAHLKVLLKKRLADLKQKNAELSERFQKQSTLNLEDELSYYSSWIVAAVHMLITIPQYRTVKTIADKLRLHQNLVQSTLLILESLQLASPKGNSWLPTSANIHLPRTSKVNALNHANWRQVILTQLQEGHDDELHYTAVHTMSLKDIDVFKNILIETLERTRELVEPSTEEELLVFTCDFFRFR